MNDQKGFSLKTDFQIDARIFRVPNYYRIDFKEPPRGTISLHRAIRCVVEDVPEVYQHATRIGYGRSDLGIKEIRKNHSKEFQSFDGWVY